MQTLYRPRIRREFAWISIDGTPRRYGWRPNSQSSDGLFALYTKRWITFFNYPYSKLHFGVLLALVQTLYRPRIRREFAWISIDGTIRRNGWRPTLQARHGLCAPCTKSGITFFNSPCPKLHFAALFALVQTLFRPRSGREFAWISIDGTIRRCRWLLILQARHGLCALCTERGITF